MSIQVRALACAAVLAACAPPAPPARTEFKGYVLGEAINLLRARQDMALNCVPPASKVDNVLCMGSTTIAGAPSSETLLTISQDGRLTSLTLQLKGEYLEQVYTALRDKYGRPTSDDRASSRRTAMWDRPDGAVIRLSHSGDSLSVTYDAVDTLKARPATKDL